MGESVGAFHAEYVTEESDEGDEEPRRSEHLRPQIVPALIMRDGEQRQSKEEERAGSINRHPARWILRHLVQLVAKEQQIESRRAATQILVKSEDRDRRNKCSKTLLNSFGRRRAMRTHRHC